ncbi:sigma-70 family RNA polymerase sigma factor [Paenibacillus tritici]|uniref:Sigma-70 family RNA polymerase sigma factor n=1 Tax=Paenibacillus tritici TaxID=1873425 RepID=A0ABX2E0T5_9BACL|nr:sigma-70 family RNA polymerase sigma factor [Paenibacillus tritici]NQX49604.1 sigma-70 family RNA polymerase sigma factor [Paenibacillus tritici]
MNTRPESEQAKELAVEQTVLQVQQGDVQAYTVIIRHFQRPIYLYCYYLLGNREEAEDAAQDIFIRALERLEQYSAKVSFSAWLYTIARNHCMDQIKLRSKGFRLLSIYRKHQQQAEPAEGSRYTEVVHGLLERLSMEERQILLLRALEEHSFEEIGIIMDMNTGTVRKKYERLRKKLGRRQNNGGIIAHEPN